jgi:hypothetical protein
VILTQLYSINSVYYSGTYLPEGTLVYLLALRLNQISESFYQPEEVLFPEAANPDVTFQG